MNSISINQLVVFSVEAIIIALLVLFLFRIRLRFGLSPLYVTLGVFQPIQVLLASSIYAEILPGVVVSPGSVIMFTASLFAVLLVYIREDAIEARKVIYGIMLANLTMTLLLFIFGLQMGLPNTLNFLNLSRDIFNQNARVMFLGTLALFADVVLIIFVYEAIWRWVTKNLFLRIYLTMGLILVFDSLFFVTGAFYGQPNYVTILTSGIIGKLGMAGLFALAMTIYLHYDDPADREAQPFEDIFYTLSYRQKFEIEHQRGQQAEQVIHEQQRMISAIADTMPAIIYVYEMENQSNQYSNSGIERVLGYHPQEIRDMGSQVFAHLIHPDDLPKVLAFQTKILAAADDDILEIDYRMKHHAGTWRHLHSYESPFLRNADGSVKQKIGIAIDITERKYAEEQVQHQLQRLNSLRAIDAAISSSFDMSFTLKIMLQQVVSQLGVDAAAILLFNPPLQTIEYVANRGFRSNVLYNTQLKLGEGYAGRSVRERKTIYIPALFKAEGKLAEAMKLAKEDFVDYYGAPLIVKGEVKGVLEIYHRSPLDSNPEWRDFLETLAGQVAIAIDNAQLFNGLQLSNIELALAYDATIVGWSRAMDLRDKETEGHTQRVTELTLKLAQQMGIPDSEIIHIRRGGLLHDIGKIDVPDNILLKADSLTDEEWEVMRRHPEFSYGMLSPIEYLKPALDIPYCHHERWDGMGYPRGLKGEQIPLAARIFAVVDVWDAITSDRPYRSAWTKENAISYIKEQSGKQFEPQVVNAFLKLIA